MSWVRASAHNLGLWCSLGLSHCFFSTEYSLALWLGSDCISEWHGYYKLIVVKYNAAKLLTFTVTYEGLFGFSIISSDDSYQPERVKAYMFPQTPAKPANRIFLKRCSCHFTGQCNNLRESCYLPFSTYSPTPVIVSVNNKGKRACHPPTPVTPGQQSYSPKNQCHFCIVFHVFDQRKWFLIWHRIVIILNQLTGWSYIITLNWVKC